MICWLLGSIAKLNQLRVEFSRNLINLQIDYLFYFILSISMFDSQLVNYLIDVLQN